MQPIHMRIYQYGTNENEGTEDYNERFYIKHPFWHSGRSSINYLYKYEIQDDKIKPPIEMDRIHSYGDRYFIDDFDIKHGDILQIITPRVYEGNDVSYYKVIHSGDILVDPYIIIKKVEIIKSSWKKVTM